MAARPTDERTLQQACLTLDVDLISLDLTQKFEKHFKFPMLGAAISRGVKIELCYGPGLLAADATAKRNLISNATQLIRVSRGRGLIISSEARNVLALRAPSDVINLASIWGLGRERGKDALSREARSVVEFARLKRTSFKGIVDIVYGGEEPTKQDKRKADVESPPGEEKAMSKRQMKRNKKVRQEAGREAAVGQ